MVLFNPVASDTLSPSSVGGVFGMYSTNDTWFLSAFGRLFLGGDDWRITLAAAGGDYNFQFYMDSPIDGWIPYNTSMAIGLVKVQRRIWGRLYGGLSYVHLDFETATEVAPGVTEESRDGLGLDLVLDRRSNVRYPRSGFETTAKYFTYPSAFGNEASSTRTEFESNHFFGAREGRDVFAARAFGGVGLGEVSFNQQFVVGRGEDLRGYTQGEYRGDSMVAVQGEYRLDLPGRFGAVAFAGVATVFGAINEDDDGVLLPGVGTGLRFTVDTETNLNVGLDIAVGRGDWGLYFKFGEAF
jgi:outer membrane protein assembly factor BamA